MLEIRLLTSADAAAYWQLRQEMLERAPNAFSASTEEHRATTIEETATRLTHLGRELPGSTCWSSGRTSSRFELRAVERLCDSIEKLIHAKRLPQGAAIATAHRCTPS